MLAVFDAMLRGSGSALQGARTSSGLHCTQGLLVGRCGGQDQDLLLTDFDREQRAFTRASTAGWKTSSRTIRSMCWIYLPLVGASGDRIRWLLGEGVGRDTGD